MAFKDSCPSYDETMAMSSAYRQPQDQHMPLSQSMGQSSHHPAPGRDDPDADENLDEFLTFTHASQIQPTSTTLPRLSRPIAIPQLIPGPGKPFSRAFPPALYPSGITQSAFLSYLDNLNIIASGTPPLRILGMTGGLIGMVPWHYAQLLSLGVQVAAKAGNRMYASARGDRFLAAVNRDFFAPRGLKVELITGEALAQMLGVEYGAIARGIAAERDGRRLVSPQTLTDTLVGKIERLDFNVPPPEKAENVLDQLSARVQAGEARKFEEKLKKGMAKDARRLRRDSSASSSSSDSSSYASSRKIDEVAQNMQKLEEWKQSRLEEVRTGERKESKRMKEEAKVYEEFEKKMEKLQEKQRKAERRSQHKASKDNKRRKGSKHGEKMDKDEEKMVEAFGKLQWIFIQNLY